MRNSYNSKDTTVAVFGGMLLHAGMVSAVAAQVSADRSLVPAALAGGSASADVEAEVVWVGMGQPADYAGKNVAGKIVLGNGSVGAVFRTAVNEYGPAGWR